MDGGQLASLHWGQYPNEGLQRPYIVERECIHCPNQIISVLVQLPARHQDTSDDLRKRVNPRMRQVEACSWRSAETVTTRKLIVVIVMIIIPRKVLVLMSKLLASFKFSIFVQAARKLEV